jgi:hypothetical protein
VARYQSENQRPARFFAGRYRQGKVSEWARRVKGAKFLWLDPPSIDEIGAIRDTIKKALKSAGKGK